MGHRFVRGFDRWNRRDLVDCCNQMVVLANIAGFRRADERVTTSVVF
jgi:hypothetical protein